MEVWMKWHALEEIQGNSFLWRWWKEISISLWFNSWAPWCRRAHPAKKMCTNGCVMEGGISLLSVLCCAHKTFSKLLAQLELVSSFTQTCGWLLFQSSGSVCICMVIYSPNPFLAPDTPGNVWCGYRVDSSLSFCFLSACACLVPSVWFRDLCQLPCLCFYDISFHFREALLLCN